MKWSNMKNHFCVTFLIVSVFLEIGLCNKNVVKYGDNPETREQRSYSTNFLESVPETNVRKYTGGMSNFIGPVRAIIVEAEGKGIFEREGHEFAIDAGNPDIHGKIQRPCQAYDSYCIRKFFAEHSKCKISGRQVPEPLFRAQSTFNILNINGSATLTNMEYRGIKDGRVVEFYIDEVTDNLVLTLDFDAVSFATADVYLKFYLRGKEPIVTRDAVGAVFLRVSVTVVIPNLKDLRLDRAEIFTSSTEPIPPFLTGPRITTSTDPEVPIMFAETLSNLPLDGIEVLVTEGVFYSSNFIQYNICDFGLKVL